MNKYANQLYKQNGSDHFMFMFIMRTVLSNTMDRLIMCLPLYLYKECRECQDCAKFIK